MREHLKRLIAPALLIAALIFPLAMTEAQRGNRKQRSANHQNQNGNSAQSDSAQQNSSAQTQNINQGRRGRRGRRGGETTGQGQKTAGGSSHAQTVVGRVNQATAPTAVINAIRRNRVWSSAVLIQGNTISPRPGRSIWQLTNGGYLIHGAEPTAKAMEQKQFFNPDGSYTFVICFCPGAGDTDPCEFADNNVTKCENAECCSLEWGSVDANGGPVR